MTLRLTESELQTIKARHASFGKRLAEASFSLHEKAHPNLVPGGHTKAAKKAKPKGMNKWEAQFAERLECQRVAGDLTWWAFEPFRIRLADGTFYRPDFVTVDKDGRTAIYEVKGHFREAARVRLKVAVEKLPYPFFLVRKHKGELRVTPV